MLPNRAFDRVVGTAEKGLRIAGRPRRIEAGIEAAATALWLGGVLLAPVWFGSNLPLVWAAHATLFGIALALYAVAGLGPARAWPVPFGRLRLPVAAFAIVLLWAVVQAVPGVPEFLWNPVWREAAATLGHPVTGAISVSPDKTWLALPCAASAAAVFLLAVQLGRSRSRARIAVYSIAVAGGIVAAYGLAVYVDGNRWVLWQPKHAYRNALTATFINRNNYGSFAGMGLVCTFGLLLARLPGSSPDRTRRTRGPLLLRCLSVLSLAAVFAAQSAALLLSGSRAAAAATVFGIVAVLGLWLMRVPSWRRPLFVAFGLAALGVLVFAAGSSSLLASRLPHVDQDMATRAAVDARSLAAIRAEPWTGYGLGTFEPAFAPFRDASLSTHGRWEYAHNDWLEALMSLGVPAGLLLWLVFGWAAYRCIWGALNRGRDAIYPAIGAGLCVLAYAHTLVDFTMQIQGFALPFLAILGIGVAQSWSSRITAGGSGQPRR